MLQVDNALSLIKLGALDGINGNGIDNTPLHDLIYLSEFPYLSFAKSIIRPECAIQPQYNTPFQMTTN